MSFKASWDGEAFVPLPHFAKHCRAEYTVDEVYTIEAYKDRSMASHKHYFARIADLHQQIPEDLEQEYPTPEHLRKRMLVKIGWCVMRDFVCASHQGALELSAWLQEMDEYSIIEVRGQIVRMWKAKSQKLHKQNSREFQQTKDKVFTEIEKLLGIAELADGNSPAAAG